MPQESKLETLTLMFHVLISLVLILSYVYLLTTGVDNETLKFAVAGVVGYWFGVTAKTAVTNRKKDKLP